MSHKYSTLASGVRENLRIFQGFQSSFICRLKINRAFPVPDRNNDLELEVSVREKTNFHEREKASRKRASLSYNSGFFAREAVRIASYFASPSLR